MGQLIKLENYISRYERDIFHYPGHYMRLKQENWKQLFAMWEDQREQLSLEAPSDDQPKQERFYNKWRRLFNRQSAEEAYEHQNQNENNHIPTTEAQLKQYFLDSLFPFQLNWASTTLSEMSFLDRDYQDDLTLKYFLQRFSDTFLFMYRPVFKLKNTTVDADIIMLTPVGIEVIKVVERPSEQSIIVGDDRTWYTEENNVRTKFLSPVITLNRTEKIVKSILNHNKLEMPITKVILSRTNQISFHLEPFSTRYIGKEQHENWLQNHRRLVSPLKHLQLKVAEALLLYSETVAVNRPEWEDPEETDGFVFE
ncbi:NERD domain-containing protein [Amphibacillus sediminis]|uniref:NERD domain-containing protein n=1 Tax=Amphibacillus sediminis TaxID=360185 RepID=UPI00082F9E99|nr:NERD domain-containing protein [Amphibacillus sediminis]